MNESRSEIQQTIASINEAWRSGHVDAMAPYLHPDIVMKFPKFAGEVAGKEHLIAGFKEFSANAQVIEYTESDQQIDIAGNCAVVSFRFDMLYERAKYRERAKGRDLWVFQRESDRWVAVWRTMVDLSEAREQKQHPFGIDGPTGAK